jgi:hypothetical protein
VLGRDVTAWLVVSFILIKGGGDVLFVVDEGQG